MECKEGLSKGLNKIIEIPIGSNSRFESIINRAFSKLPPFEGKADGNDIEFAAWTHAEFVKIHPYVDGNGRTARMIMNYQLMASGFLPVSIAKENRLEYFEALEAYAVNGDLSPFAEMIALLEEQRLDEYLGIVQEK